MTRPSFTLDLSLLEQDINPRGVNFLGIRVEEKAWLPDDVLILRSGKNRVIVHNIGKEEEDG